MEAKKYYLKLVIICVMALTQLKAIGQDSFSNINVTADFVSRYVWRGQDYGTSPAIQPTLAWNYHGLFELGVWGSFNIKGTYSETDPYIKFFWKNLSLVLTDYFIYNDTASYKPDFYNIKKKETNHVIEAALQYKLSGKFPIRILLGSYFWGNDRAWGFDVEKDTTLKNYYSTYVELGYSLECHQNNLDILLGITPFAGAYGNKAGIVNLGITATRKIVVSPAFEIPVKVSLITNPELKRVFLVFGMTL